MIRANKKSFHLSARNLHDECSFCIHLHQNYLLWAFAAGILWRTQPWNFFTGVRTAKRIATCNHDSSLGDDYCVPFSKFKFLIPTLGWTEKTVRLPSPDHGFASRVGRSGFFLFWWRSVSFLGPYRFLI